MQDREERTESAHRVAVITATIGHPMLHRAVESVMRQTYRHIEHWIVVDGVEFEASVRESLARAPESDSAGRSLLVLARRTGHSGWCSHRIYAAMPFLVDADFVCYLDQDNWYEEDHVQSLVQALVQQGSPAAYSLRNIYDRSGHFICRDDCQSLGHLSACHDAPGQHHVDSSCWIFRREAAVHNARHWMTPLVGDRLLAREMLRSYPDLPCTRRHTLNYTAGSRRESAPVEYFIRGNATVRRQYPGGLPWELTR